MSKSSIAQDFNMTLASGKPASFYDLAKDKTAVLFFYPSSSSYSKTCQKQAAAFNGALGELGPNVQVIGVASGDIKDLIQFQQKFASNFPVGLIDKQTQANYKARITGFCSWFVPSALAPKRVTFIITPDHKIAERIDLPVMANGPQMTAHVKDVVEKVKALSLTKKPEIKADSNSGNKWQNGLKTAQVAPAGQQIKK